MNRFLKFLHSFILTINVGVVILLLICGFAYKIKPEYSFLAAFLGYGFPVMALANIFFVFYWLVRFKGWIFLSLVGMMLSYSSFQAWFPINLKSRTTSMDQTTQKIKVLSYNIMYLGFDTEKELGQLDPIIEYINDKDPDIICLQEAGAFIWDMAKTNTAVMKAFEEYPYRCSGEDENKYSVLLFSKFPILYHRRIDYVSLSNSSYVYDLKVGKDTIRLINNHLESNKLNKEDKTKYSDLLTKEASDPLKDVAKTLGSKVGNASFIRANQADSVSKVVLESPYKVILCGDFNDVPGSYTYRTIRQGLVDAWIEHGNGWGNTFHENFFLFRIDYIMHSPSIKSTSVKIDKVKLSDHYPIWANLEF